MYTISISYKVIVKGLNSKSKIEFCKCLRLYATQLKDIFMTSEHESVFN